MLESENLSQRDYVLQQAMSLDVEDRAYVVVALEESLNVIDFATPQISAAWAKEIERRAEACGRGDMPAEDWRDVTARLRAINESTIRAHT